MTFRYIFQVKVTPGKEESFEKAWHNGSVPIQQCPGAQGTRLHKKLGTKNLYIAIAEWESVTARTAAFATLDQPGNPLGEEMRHWGHNSVFGEVTLIAEIDEIDSVFPPE
jgi:heme-degrading monooxygenase HmoA